MTLSFIIVTWNSDKYIKNCIRSINHKCTKEHISFEIIIIDNGSTDKTLDIINKSHQSLQYKLTLISLNKNMGTTYTRNAGLQKARGKYICIIDSDTEISGSGSIRSILRLLDNDQRIGLIAPKLILPDGTIQNSVKKFPSFVGKLKKIPKAILGLNLGDSDFYEDFPFTEERVVDTAISACWFFKKELVEAIGYLDENIFYSPEDIDYSIRIYKHGLNILYFPNVEVYHHTQQISHAKPFSKLSISHFFGLIYYFRKHGGWLRPPSR